MVGVYQFRNTETDFRYIGSSKYLEDRKEAHLWDLRLGRHYNKHFQRAWNKYGEEKFEYSVLAVDDDIEKIRVLEREHILANKGKVYNYWIATENVFDNMIASAPLRKKISEKCSGEKNGNYGRKHTPEELKIMRDRRWGEGYIAKRQLPKAIRQPLSAEAREKISKANTGKVRSAEARQKYRECRLGKKLSSKTKKILSDTFSDGRRKGSNNANSRISAELAYKIYDELCAGVPKEELEAKYNLGGGYVYCIKNKEHWAFMDEKKQVSLEQEERVAALWNGKRTPQSGGGKWKLGDILTEDFLLEAKTSLTPKPSYSIKRSILDKANKQRSEMGKRFYAQAFTFGDDKDFYILPENAVAWLLSFKEELCKMKQEIFNARKVMIADKQEAVENGTWTADLQQQYRKTERLISALLEQLDLTV